MKPSMILLLISICVESFGATITINGLPSPLEYKDEQYYWPQNIAIRPGTENLYITMDGINMICFLNTAPQGLLQQISEISVIIHGVKSNWNCFPYKTTVFEARP